MKTITLKLTKQEIMDLPVKFETKYCEVLDKNSDNQYWSVIIKNTDRLKKCLNEDMKNILLAIEKKYSENVTYLQNNYDNLKSVLTKLDKKG